MNRVVPSARAFARLLALTTAGCLNASPAVRVSEAGQPGGGASAPPPAIARSDADASSDPPFAEAERPARAEEVWRLFFETPPQLEAAKKIVRRLRVGAQDEERPIDSEPIARSAFVRVGTAESTLLVERSSLALRAFLPRPVGLFRDVELGDILVDWRFDGWPPPGEDAATQLLDLRSMQLRRGVERAHSYARGGSLFFAYAWGPTQLDAPRIAVLDAHALSEKGTIVVTNRWGGEPSLLASPDGSVVVLRWEDGVRLWSARSLGELRRNATVDAIAFDRRGHEAFLLASGSIERARLPELSLLAKRPLALPKRGRAPDLRLSPDERYVFVASDRELAIVDARSLEVVVPYHAVEYAPLPPGAPPVITFWSSLWGTEPRVSVDVDRDGRFLVARARGGGIVGYELSAAKPQRLSREIALEKAAEIDRMSTAVDETMRREEEALRVKITSRLCQVGGYVFPKELCE